MDRRLTGDNSFFESMMTDKYIKNQSNSVSEVYLLFIKFITQYLYILLGRLKRTGCSVTSFTFCSVACASFHTSWPTSRVPRLRFLLVNENHQKLMDQDGSKELEMEWIGQAVVELQHLQEFVCLTGNPTRVRWANDHTVTHLQAKLVIRNFWWSVSAQQFWSTIVSTRIWVYNRNSQKGPMGKWHNVAHLWTNIVA